MATTWHRVGTKSGHIQAHSTPLAARSGLKHAVTSRHTDTASVSISFAAPRADAGFSSAKQA